MLLRQLLSSAVLTLSLLATNVLAQQQKIRVVTEEWPPYNYTDQNGEVTGIATSILKEALQEADLEYQIEVYSWSRAFALARDNPSTLLYTIYKIGDRVDKFQWICPLITTRGVAFFALAEREDIKLHSLNDAKKYLTGSIAAGVNYDFLLHEGFKYGEHFDIATDEYANLRKLFKRRIDLIIQEVEPLKLRMKEQGLPYSALKRVYTVIPNDGQIGCMAFSNDTSKELVDLVKKSLSAVKNRRKAALGEH